MKDVKAWTCTLAILFAVMHTLGNILRLAGGQGFVDWVAAIHFTRIQTSLLPFDAATFVVGIVAALVSGAVIGWLFASIYNRVAKWKKK